jgi:hypothetical protein
VDGVTAVALEDGPIGPSSIVTYRTTCPRETNPRAVARLVETGAAVVTVSSEERSLEDAYAAVVQSEGVADRETNPSRSRDDRAN